MGFLRHKQASLNNGRKRQLISTASPRKHYLMLPASDYPLAGCSPAEPASVLSDNII